MRITNKTIDVFALIYSMIALWNISKGIYNWIPVNILLLGYYGYIRFFKVIRNSSMLCNLFIMRHKAGEKMYPQKEGKVNYYSIKDLPGNVDMHHFDVEIKEERDSQNIYTTVNNIIKLNKATEKAILDFVSGSCSLKNKEDYDKFIDNFNQYKFQKPVIIRKEYISGRISHKKKRGILEELLSPDIILKDGYICEMKTIIKSMYYESGVYCQLTGIKDTFTGIDCEEYERRTQENPNFPEEFRLEVELTTCEFDHFISLSTGHVGTVVGNYAPIMTYLNKRKLSTNPFEWIKKDYVKNMIDMDRWNRLIQFNANAFELSVDEYKDFVYWCYANPRTIEKVINDGNKSSLELWKESLGKKCY